MRIRIPTMSATKGLKPVASENPISSSFHYLLLNPAIRKK
jgi:hypothetical protein